MKFAPNDRNDKMFLLTLKFRPQGVVSPCPGAIYMYKIMKKKCIKSDFQKNFFKLNANEHSDKRFLLTSKFCPLWLSAPDLRLYTCIKYEKSGIKSDVKEIFLKLATNDRSDRMFLLTLKCRPQGVVSPYSGAIYMYKIMKKLYKIRLQSCFFFKVVAHDRSNKRFLLTSKFCSQGLSAPDLRLYNLFSHV